MSMHENTLANLAERLLRVPLRDWKGGVATGGSTSTLSDTSREEADDYFNNTTPVSYVHVLSTTDGAAPVGETCKATDFTNTDGVITITPNFTVAPAAGDTYCILSEYKWEEIVEAINMAIDIASSNQVLVEKLDETTLLQTTAYEYNIPTGFTHIYRLSQADGSGDFPDPIPPTHYKVIRGADIPKIHFYRFPVELQNPDIYYGELWISSDLSDGRAMRIEGFGRQPKLVNSTDACRIDPNFIVYQAAALLHGSRIIKADADFDNNRVRAEYSEGKAREFLADAKRACQMPPNTKKVVR